MRICGVYVCRVAFQLTAEDNAHTHARLVVGVSVCAQSALPKARLLEEKKMPSHITLPDRSSRQGKPKQTHKF